MGRRRFWPLAIGSLVSILGSSPQLYAEPVILGQYEEGLRGSIDGFPFLLLRGTHYQRGKAYGVLAAQEILTTCNLEADFINQSGLLTWDQAIEGMRLFHFPSRFETELTGMLAGIQEALPNVSDRRVESLGREITLDDLKVIQTGEIFELAQNGMLVSAEAFPGWSQCSQFSAWGDLTADGDTIIGRNWDYPPLFPVENSFVLAIDPAEPELKPTLDAMFFGLIGSGMFTLNEDFAYLAGNDGSINEGGFFGSEPTPGTLVMRMTSETTRAGLMLEDFTAALQQKVTLALIFHLSFPMAGNPTDPVRVVEFDPRPTGYGTKVRAPDQDLPQAIILTNHFLLSGSTQSGDSVDRYQRIKNALMAHLQNQEKVGFPEAQAIMNSVSKSYTLYTAVIWPKSRSLQLAVQPSPGVSATQGIYHQISWDEIFSLQVIPDGEEPRAQEPNPEKEPTPDDTGNPFEPPADGGQLNEFGAEDLQTAQDSNLDNLDDPVRISGGCGCSASRQEEKSTINLAWIALAVFGLFRGYLRNSTAFLNSLSPRPSSGRSASRVQRG